jgi:hypothetical protein
VDRAKEAKDEADLDRKPAATWIDSPLRQLGSVTQVVKTLVFRFATSGGLGLANQYMTIKFRTSHEMRPYAMRILLM